MLDIVASALQTAAINDPRLDNGGMRPPVPLSNEDSRHLARAAIHAIESAGFLIVLKEGTDSLQ